MRCQTDPVNRATAPIGALGSVLIAASSWWVGAVPHAYQAHPPTVLDWFPIGGIVPRIAFYVGLTLLTGAWLAIGRAVVGIERSGLTVTLQRITLAWAAPMMFAVPLASRDLWAYAAQGHLISRGLDPYRFTPSDVPGIFADNVSPGWIHSTAPYGPLWLGLNHAIAELYGNHVFLAVFLLRIPVVVGLLLLLWAVPRMAARTGIRADRAIWLTALSPLTIELILGAGHNDLLMAGLLACGAAYALGDGSAARTLLPAAAAMALATAIKSPAAIGVAFVVPLWLGSRATRATRADLHRAATATAETLITAAITFAVVSLVTGFGLGWINQVGASAKTVNWLSLPTDAAILADAVTGHLHGSSHLDHPMQTWRAAGLVVAAALIAVSWLIAVSVALERPLPRLLKRLIPTPSTSISVLGLAMLTVIVLGPAVQLWYLIWALPFLTAMTSHRRRTIALVATAIAMVYTVDPHGLSFTMKPTVVPIIAASALAAWLVLRNVPFGRTTAPSRSNDSAAGHHDADGAGPGVHADGRGHL